MIIKEGEPWLLWPDKVSYGINKGNISETFEGFTDFTLAINLELLTFKDEKRTIFAKLPNYCGLDIEFNNKPLLILKILKNGNEEYKYITSSKEIYNGYNMFIYRYNKNSRKVEVLVNSETIIEYTLEQDEELTAGHEPHIIFGAGNFPHNDFNMNLCSYNTDFLLISKSCLMYDQIVDIKNGGDLLPEIVGLYDFKKHTKYKVHDLTNNCNFLHKII
jgi:hypothetical protein